MNQQTICHHCEGKGYTEIRDCGGDIQRTERCSFCEGLGRLDREAQLKTNLTKDKVHLPTA